MDAAVRGAPVHRSSVRMVSAPGREGKASVCRSKRGLATMYGKKLSACRTSAYDRARESET